MIDDSTDNPEGFNSDIPGVTFDGGEHSVKEVLNHPFTKPGVWSDPPDLIVEGASKDEILKKLRIMGVDAQAELSIEAVLSEGWRGDRFTVATWEPKWVEFFKGKGIGEISDFQMNDGTRSCARLSCQFLIHPPAYTAPTGPFLSGPPNYIKARLTECGIFATFPGGGLSFDKQLESPPVPEGRPFLIFGGVKSGSNFTLIPCAVILRVDAPYGVASCN